MYSRRTSAPGDVTARDLREKAPLLRAGHADAKFGVKQPLNQRHRPVLVVAAVGRRAGPMEAYT
jgi:hypothetical protein